jgi:hypothetical protein
MVVLMPLFAAALVLRRSYIILSFAVFSTLVSTIGLRLRLVVPRPMPAAVGSRCCGRRFQQLACA